MILIQFDWDYQMKSFGFALFEKLFFYQTELLRVVFAYTGT